MPAYPLFISCPRGLENVLSAELAACGATDLGLTEGGVSCRGNLQTVYRINLSSRTAGRVLLQVAQGTLRHEQDVYALAAGTDWPQWFDVTQSFKVRIDGKKAALKSLEFAALKTKDAVCDVFRRVSGSRPNVSKNAPDVQIQVFVAGQRATVFVDTSGEALFKRGYRGETGVAPLRENLAAGLLLLAGYDGSRPFMDPFCGSGTLAIEAALIATARAPGLQRRFGFERLKNFDAALWQRLRQQAAAAVCPAPAPIGGGDTDRSLLRAAAANALAAGVGDCIRWQHQDALDSRPNGAQGLMLSNPPYGVRLAEIQALHALYPQLGAWLKQHFAGWTAGLFTADREMPRLMRLSPKRKIPLYNGNLDARLFLLDMVAGSNRQP